MGCPAACSVTTRTIRLVRFPTLHDVRLPVQPAIAGARPQPVVRCRGLVTRSPFGPDSVSQSLIDSGLACAEQRLSAAAG